MLAATTRQIKSLRMGPPSNRDRRTMDKRHRPSRLGPSIVLYWLATATQVSSISVLLNLVQILTCRITDGASVSAGPLPSPPPMVTRETTPLNPSADTQGASNQKRPRSSTQPTILSVDGAPRKRPRRATKETWKAREARKALEGFEAKPSQTLLNPCRKKQTPFTSPDSDRGDVVSKVVNIEDVNVGEDGSIQCLVTLKPSLIEIENVVGRVLLRRCEELFGKRYGHKGVQRRAITKRHT